MTRLAIHVHQETDNTRQELKIKHMRLRVAPRSWGESLWSFLMEMKTLRWQRKMNSSANAMIWWMMRMTNHQRCLKRIYQKSIWRQKLRRKKGWSRWECSSLLRRMKKNGGDMETPPRERRLVSSCKACCSTRGQSLQMRLLHQHLRTPSCASCFTVFWWMSIWTSQQ